MAVSPQFTTASLQSFLTFPFRSTNWKNKFLLASLLGLASYLIPIVPMLPLLGYQAEIIRRTASGENAGELPEWNDWGKLFLDGLRLFGLIFIVLLPQLVLMVGWYVFMMVSIFSAQNNAGQAAGLMLSSMALYFLGFFLVMIWSIAISFLLPPAMTHAAVTRSFTAAFHIRQWWGIFKANFLGFLVALIVLLGTFYLLYMAVALLYLTIIGCILIPLALAPLIGYMTIISGALFGTVYREGQEKLAARNLEPAPIAPEPAGIG